MNSPTLFYDLITRSWVDENGAPLPLKRRPYAVANTRFTLCVQLVRVEGLSVLPADDSWTSTENLLAAARLLNVNGETLAEGQNFDLGNLSSGKISFKLNLMTENLTVALNGNKSKGFSLAIELRYSDGSLAFQSDGEILIYTDLMPQNASAEEILTNPPRTLDLPETAEPGVYLRQIEGGVRSWVKGFLSVTWDKISGKPSMFPPSQHNHTTDDISGLSHALSAKASKPSETTPPDHALTWNDSGWGKVPFPPRSAPVSHQHQLSDVETLPDKLREFAPSPLSMTPDGYALAWSKDQKFHEVPLQTSLATPSSNGIVKLATSLTDGGVVSVPTAAQVKAALDTLSSKITMLSNRISVLENGGGGGTSSLPFSQADYDSIQAGQTVRGLSLLSSIQYDHITIPVGTQIEFYPVGNTTLHPGYKVNIRMETMHGNGPEQYLVYAQDSQNLWKWHSFKPSGGIISYDSELYDGMPLEFSYYNGTWIVALA